MRKIDAEISKIIESAEIPLPIFKIVNSWGDHLSLKLSQPVTFTYDSPILYFVGTGIGASLNKDKNGMILVYDIQRIKSNVMRCLVNEIVILLKPRNLKSKKNKNRDKLYEFYGNSSSYVFMEDNENFENDVYSIYCWMKSPLFKESDRENARALLQSMAVKHGAPL